VYNITRKAAGRRLQTAVNDVELDKCLGARNLLRYWSKLFKTKFGMTATNWVWVYGEKGVRTQTPHTDLPWDSNAVSAQESGHLSPLVALFGLQEGAHIILWPGSHRADLQDRIAPVRVDIHPGQCLRWRGVACVLLRIAAVYCRVPRAGRVLVMSGDLVHSGGAYQEEENIRVHTYLDVKRFPRTTNQTQYISLNKNKWPYIIMPRYL
jgi:hypothetical protein